MGKNDDDIRLKINQLKDVYSKIDLRLSKGYKMGEFMLTYKGMKYLGYEDGCGMISVHTSDKYGTYLYVDDMCEKLFGLTPEEYLGKSAEDVDIIMQYHDEKSKHCKNNNKPKEDVTDDGIVYRIRDDSEDNGYTWVYTKNLVVGNVFYCYTKYASSDQIYNLYFQKYGIKTSKNNIPKGKTLKQ